MTIHVYIVDDHALVRAGMRMILDAEPGIEVVGEAESAEVALPQIRSLKPQVVLCDLHLPGMSGLELTERIVSGQRGTAVITVSVLEDGPMPRRMLDAGASGYVGKGGDASELVRAVRSVAEGRRYLGSSVAQNMALSSLAPSESPFDPLSARELEIALLLVQGMRQSQIAEKLSLSPKTVHTHKSRMFTQLRIKDTVALTRLASQYGLVEASRVVA